MIRHLAAAAVVVLLCLASSVFAQRQMERLGRGVVAVRAEDHNVFVSWRLLGTDPDLIAFNIYRTVANGEAVKLNAQPITKATSFTDATGDAEGISYFIRPVIDGVEQPPAAPVKPAAASYLTIPLQTLPGHTPNDASVGDLDGDGEYEIVLKQEMRPRDNSRDGATGETKLEAYRLDGTFIWRINLGRNIREGAHYTQFIVYDLDGDGRAEVACKTADGTTDGAGKVIGDAGADHRNEAGHVIRGPEFLTIFDGATGKALASTEYLAARGEVGSWGDDDGNRSERYLACVAYLDGTRPSLVMCRGYYARTTLSAWNWRDGKFSHLWTFDSDDGTPGNDAYRNQGNHNLSVADVDEDGRDEIVYGSCVIDDTGKGLYSTALGHGDAMHLADHDPDRPGLEVFGIHERPRHPNAAAMYDGKTGRLLWGIPSRDVPRGLAVDIDQRHRGSECWAYVDGPGALYNARGEKVADGRPRSCNFAVWWDGDLLRELLDRNTVSKWNWVDGSMAPLLVAEGCTSNNGSKSNPALSADILGDWREEVVLRTVDNKQLRIYTTTIPSEHRIPTLMHDPQYRLSVAWQNVAYNQPPHTGFYLGEGMAKPPRSAMTLPADAGTKGVERE